MPLTFRFPRALRGLATGLVAGLLLLALGACTSTPPAAPAAKSLLEQDVTQATEALVERWRERRWLPLFLTRLAPQPLAVGAFTDLAAAGAGRAGFAMPQSLASARARQIVARRLGEYAPEVRLGSNDAPSLLLTAQMRPQAAPDTRRQLTLLLLDLRSGEVLARWDGLVRSLAADAYPSAFDTDSPVLINESPAAAAARARLFDGQAGVRVADEDETRNAAAAALLAQAQQAYADGDYPTALRLFERAAVLPSTHSIRAYNGLYLSHLKLGQTEQARQAFKSVVSEGLAARALAVKLLFVPGQTEFLADPAVRGAYESWLQEIAAQAAASLAACLDIVGHTSHTGEETFNQELSLQRSQRVQALLQGHAPGLERRLSVIGKGWSENIVGSGTDDARDAIDRRVEFRVVDCPV